jgi:hypothetical protein
VWALEFFVLSVFVVLRGFVVFVERAVLPFLPAAAGALLFRGAEFFAVRPSARAASSFSTFRRFGETPNARAVSSAVTPLPVRTAGAIV